MRKLLLLLLLPFLSGVAQGRDLYVDGRNGVDNYRGYCVPYDKSRGSYSAPLRNFSCAMATAQPGDNIHLLPTIVYSALYINQNGAPGRPITIIGEGAAPNLTRVINGTSQNSMQAAVKVFQASYINIKNLDVTTPNSAHELAGAEGIFIVQSHHIVVSGNRLHDCGGGGVQTSHSDYLTITTNTVYNNSYDSTAGSFGSGISVLASQDVDGNTSSYKIQITKNLIYGNHNEPRYPEDSRNYRGSQCLGDLCYIWGQTSDGNGIILDRNYDTNYRGKMLVANNLIFGNGGRGIHLYRTNNVDVMYNSMYLNNKDVHNVVPHEGEIMVHFSGNVNVFNNICYSDGIMTPFYYQGKRYNYWPHIALSIANPTGGAVNADHNILYAQNRNPSMALFVEKQYSDLRLGSNNKWADPHYVGSSTDPSRYDLHLQSWSPAINFAAPQWRVYDDYRGRVRSTQTPAAGAYEQ